MAQSTDEKLLHLKELFPKYDTDGLLDVLVSCDGSLKRSADFLGGSVSQTDTPDLHPKRLKTKSQQSLSRYLEVNALHPIPNKVPASKSKPRPLELHGKEQIEANIPYCTYHTDVLPSEVADKLLQQLLEDRNHKPNKFYLFGNLCTSNCASRLFVPEAREKPFFYNGKEVKNPGNYTDEMMLAQVVIENVVNEAISKRPPLPFQVKANEWEAQAVLSNVYKKDSNLDWHSDRLTNIGPQAIIASLSLGFSREFRVRKSYPSNSQVFSLLPQHNSLIIMHAGFQEEYKHCVPKLGKGSRIPKEDLHPISGTTRVNLTYRNYVMTENVFCKLCGCPMELRRTFKEPRKRGSYIYQCSRSYTAANGFHENQECKGFAFANFCKTPPLVSVDSEGSHWLAEDDTEARELQSKDRGPSSTSASLNHVI